MAVSSFLTGKRGVSLPFSDCCPALIRDAEHFRGLVEAAIQNGKKAGWKYLEWRGGGGHFDGKRASRSYVHHNVDISLAENRVFSNLRGSTKRNIKKAAKEGVQVHFENSLASIQEFYRLHCLTRKHHGVPPQPFKFFEKIQEHILSKGSGFVILASHQGKKVAGGVYFHFGKKALYKYGASDRRNQLLRANNLVMWEALKHYAEKGYETLSLGRTDLGSTGLLQFKRGWGAVEQMLNYHKYDFGKADFVENQGEAKTSYALLKKLPSPVLNFAGSLFYRHVG
jgi:lipid II:glycine glycyltransferase (peptidoglycan interpeptide bridge formation enzyme)